MPTNMPPRPAAPQSAPGMGGKVLVGLGCLAVGLLIGYGAGRVSTGTPINPLSNQKGGYEAGYQAALKKVSDSGLLPPAPSESASIEGTVKTVVEGRLTIATDIGDFDPLDLKDLPKERTVTVTDATEIVSLTEMSPEEFSAAQRAYQQASADFQPDPDDPTVTPPVPPPPFKETKVSLAALKDGDRVLVIAAADILAAATFEAVRIMILPAPSVGSPPGEPPPTTPGEPPPPPLPPPPAEESTPPTPPAPPSP